MYKNGMSASDRLIHIKAFVLSYTGRWSEAVDPFVDEYTTILARKAEATITQISRKTEKLPQREIAAIQESKLVSLDGASAVPDIDIHTYMATKSKKPIRL